VQYQPAGSFLKLKGYVMNIDDMGDNTRLPKQRKPCHYWPDCECGPSGRSSNTRRGIRNRRGGNKTIIAIFCGIAAVLSSALALIL
jgi:hypothetical protein